MNKYGCWNRKPLLDKAEVQSGWIETFNHDEQVYTRSPIMIMIKDPMTKTCIYQRDKKDDPKCLGCKELEK